MSTSAQINQLKYTNTNTIILDLLYVDRLTLYLKSNQIKLNLLCNNYQTILQSK